MDAGESVYDRGGREDRADSWVDIKFESALGTCATPFSVVHVLVVLFIMFYVFSWSYDVL